MMYPWRHPCATVRPWSPTDHRPTVHKLSFVSIKKRVFHLDTFPDKAAMLCVEVLKKGAQKLSKLPRQWSGCSTTCCKPDAKQIIFVYTHLLTGGFKTCSLKSRSSAPNECNAFQKADKSATAKWTTGFSRHQRGPAQHMQCQQTSCAQLWEHRTDLASVWLEPPFSKGHRSQIAL